MASRNFGDVVKAAAVNGASDQKKKLRRGRRERPARREPAHWVIMQPRPRPAARILLHNRLFRSLRPRSASYASRASQFFWPSPDCSSATNVGGGLSECFTRL